MSLKSISQAPGRSLSAGQDFVRTSSRRYRALFDAGDDEFYVYLNCGYAINTPHPTDPAQLVTGIEIDQVKPQTSNPSDNTAAGLWDISLNYGPWNPLEFSFDGNPLNLPTRFHFEFLVTEVPAFADVDGNPIVNAAGDPYDPPLMRKVTRCTLFVNRNESAASVNFNTLQALSNTLNLYVFNGFPVATVCLNPIKLPEVAFSQVTDQFYFPMQYVFDVNYDTWIAQVVNAGFRCLDALGNLIPILIKGQQATTPVPLTVEGAPILAPEFSGTGGGGGDDDADSPPDSSPTGYTGEATGGGQPPMGGSGVATGANIVINAYQLDRSADFAVLNMTNLFTLPTI
jgi:hypothetical protein